MTFSAAAFAARRLSVVWVLGLGLVTKPGCAPAGPPPGQHLVEQFQCATCHAPAGRVAELPIENNCAGCHEALFTDHFSGEFTAAGIAKWRGRVTNFRDLPSLADMADLEPAWIANYLDHPVDLRPGEPSRMPRLPLDAQQRRDIASFLTGVELAEGLDADPPSEISVASRPRSPEAKEGDRLIVERACTACHVWGNQGPTQAPFETALDLGRVSNRRSSAWLSAWLTDPQAVRPDSPMPRPDLSAEERAAVILALQAGPPQAPAVAALPTPLPLLDREIHWAEVQQRVFGRSCQHCHAKPTEWNGGNAGPGNTGGFGYAGAGLDLSSLEGLRAGTHTTDGRSADVLAGPEPILLRVLRDRQVEATLPREHWPSRPGMPLGLEPLSPEDIQLVASWIAQGAPE